MKTAIMQITLADLSWMALPVSVMLLFYIRWSDDRSTIFIALARMVLQLFIIGYLLTLIFASSISYLTMIILIFMLFFASIIAMRPLSKKDKNIYLYILLSIFTGGVFTLVIVVFGVLHLKIWYEPRFVIPLAGMLFANAMNSVSLAAERFFSERERNVLYKEARAIAYKAALIPIINSFFAVGLVSLPGMMTGQILSGVDPTIAVRYQMMVMLMVLSSSGISVAIYLLLIKKSEI